MKYNKVDFKYKTLTDEFHQSKYRPIKDIVTKYGSIQTNGMIMVYKGFLYNGPTAGIHTDNTLVPTLFHDFLYTLMEEGLLSKLLLIGFFRNPRMIADNLFYYMLRKRKMNIIRATYFRLAVRKFGGETAKTKKKKIYTAT